MTDRIADYLARVEQESSDIDNMVKVFGAIVGLSQDIKADVKEQVPSNQYRDQLRGVVEGLAGRVFELAKTKEAEGPRTEKEKLRVAVLREMSARIREIR